MNKTLVIGLSMVGVHLLLALFLKLVVGIDTQVPSKVGDWDWYYQTIPTADLLSDPFTSVWYFHAQPPLYNLWGAFLMWLFHPNHLQALHYSNIVMGSLCAGMGYGIAYRFTKSNKPAMLVGFAIAVSPAFFLYEAYILYDTFVAFFVTASIFLLSISGRWPKWRLLCLAGFIATLNVLVLSRSFFHLIFVLPGILIACLLAKRRWKELLLIGCCVTLLPLGWYAKNQNLFGLFTGSSWVGLNVSKIVRANYTDEELQSLAAEGVIDQVFADQYSLYRPHRFVDYGFDKSSDIEILNRNDFNNINIPDISKVYLANSIRLITHDPLHYAKNVVRSFGIFSAPAYAFYQLDENRSKLGWYDRVLLRNFSLDLAGHRASLMTLALPFILLLYAFQLSKLGLSLARWQLMIRSDGPMFFTAVTIVYTILISSCFEIGEGFRPKFYIEVATWAFTVAVCYRFYLSFGEKFTLKFPFLSGRAAESS
jgi:hypothetical protein